MERKLSPSQPDAAEAEAREQALAKSAARRRIAPRVGDVAVLPLFGMMMHRASLISQSSGVTSLAQFRQDFRTVMDDKAVGAVLLQIDSPGGSVNHVAETADEIFNARTRKPVVAIADVEAASAAYWLGAQASEFVVTPSGRVGSIGVMAVHKDESAKHEAEGVRFQVIRAGKFKNEGAEGPLDDDALGHQQSIVDGYYDQFIDAVARGRGVTAQTVRGGYGQGRVVAARAARSAGMVDRVATFEDTLSRLTSRGGRARQASETARDRFAFGG